MFPREDIESCPTCEGIKLYVQEFVVYVPCSLSVQGLSMKNIMLSGTCETREFFRSEIGSSIVTSSKRRDFLPVCLSLH